MTNVSLSPEFLEQLKSKCDIVDVASKYITLNRRGQNYWACCPFHSEKTPSFSIKQDGQFFKCFGCGESGNVISLIKKFENVDFMGAVEFLCDYAGVEMPSASDSAEIKQKKQFRDKLYSILKATTEFYQNNLKKTTNSLQTQYLKKRNISNEMQEKFKLGASLNFDDLPKYLAKLGYTETEMLSAGVVGKLEDSGKLYDFYGTRLIFPIFNVFGDVVAFSGRSVEDNPTRTKYKNTPQTEIFNKSEIMFGYNFAKELKKERMLDTLIIVEGHIDVIMCHQAGVTNTIGCMGTALTFYHARKIKQLVDNVILCLDGDNAGATASYKAINVLKEVGLNVKVVRLNEAKDPDEYIKRFGKDNFVETLYAGQDCVDFILNDCAQKYNFENNADRTKYIQEALEYISKFSSPAEQEIYLSSVQKKVKVPMDALRKSLAGNSMEHQSHKSEEDTKVENVSDNYIKESKIMLLSSMLYKKLTNFETISGLFESNDELSQLYKFLSEKIKENQNFNVSTLFDNFEINSKSLIDKVINYVFPSDEVFDTYLKETIKRIKILELEKSKNDIKNLMLKATTEEERYVYLSKLQKITIQINEEKL